MGKIIVVNELFGEGAFDSIEELLDAVESAFRWRPVVREDGNAYLVRYYVDICGRRMHEGVPGFSRDTWLARGAGWDTIAEKVTEEIEIKIKPRMYSESLGRRGFNDIGELLDAIREAYGWRPVVFESGSRYMIRHYKYGFGVVLEGMPQFRMEEWFARGAGWSVIAELGGY